MGIFNHRGVIGEKQNKNIRRKQKFAPLWRHCVLSGIKLAGNVARQQAKAAKVAGENGARPA